jgi:hypothetical protein
LGLARRCTEGAAEPRRSGEAWATARLVSDDLAEHAQWWVEILREARSQPRNLRRVRLLAPPRLTRIPAVARLPYRCSSIVSRGHTYGTGSRPCVI